MCPLCGELLQPARRARASDTALAEPARESEPSARRSSPEAWSYLAIGALTAPVFALTPLLGFMGWFLASLVHEMGHAAFAWLCGMPAFPAIALDGHAAAMHGEQLPVLALLIAVALASSAWRWLDGRARWVAAGLLALGYPAVAFTPARELLHLLAGHGAELAFATLALWKTLDGGFTDSKAERGLYGTVGWFLWGKNVALCWGLVRSPAARAEYESSGSFGLTNDYLRVARDVLGWRVESVALVMLLLALAVLPAALGLWRASLVARASRRA